MSLKMMGIDDLMKVLNCGAGLTMNASGRSVPDLMKLAVMAGSSKVPLTLHGVSMLELGDMMKIANSGSGHVIFTDAEI